MHYYKRNIGDYHRKAGRLTILQHGVYVLLMDACYDRERFPTRDEAIDWVWASTPDEECAVDFVLRKFFEQDPDGRFIQKRIAEELDWYGKHREIQSENGKKGGRPKKPNGFSEKPNGFSDEPKKSQWAENKTLTNNHEPITNNKDKDIGQKRKRFVPPTPEDVKAFAREKGLTIDAEYFVDFYVSKGWMVGKNPMRDWQATVRNWARKNSQPDRQHLSAGGI